MSRIVIHIEEQGQTVRRFGMRGSRVRWLVALGVLGALTVVGGAAGGAWYARGQVGNGPSAQAENAVLKARLQTIEARQIQVDRALERVMAYDSKIRQLTQVDEGARAFGIGPLSELELAAAERDRRLGLPGEELVLGDDSAGLDGMLEQSERRADMLEDRIFAEEESLQEVRAYLDDRASLLGASPSTWPVRGWVTSGYGWRDNPRGGGRKMHAGLDVAAPRGTPIIAAADGHVTFAGYHSAYGNMVVIDHGYGMTTKYGHCSRLHVQVGDRIQRGELIGKVGNTGRSTGPHLHFEVLQDGVHVNPKRFLVREG